MSFPRRVLLGFMFLQQAMACLRFSPDFFVRTTIAFMLFTAAVARPFYSGLQAEACLWEMPWSLQKLVKACL